VEEMKEMRHEEIRERLLRKREELSPADRMMLEQHMESCQDCREFAQNVEVLEGELRDALHARWDPVEVPPLGVEVRGYRKL
jgi:anti-sigma factor RsiW